MKNILIPIDFSEASEKAIEYINEAFDREKINITLVHINNTDTDIDNVKNEYDVFKGRVLTNVRFNYEFFVEYSPLLEGITNSIEKYKPELVVMGTTGSTTHSYSNTLSFIKRTNCPILTIPENLKTKGITRIAYANDFHTIQDSDALRPLLDLARTFNAKVYIIHINQKNKVLHDEAENALEYYLDYIDHEYVNITTKNIEEGIEQYLEEKEIDLLTVLLRDHGNNELNGQGRLVKELIGNAQVPVLNLI